MKRFLIVCFLFGKLYAQNWAPINIPEKFNYDLGNTGYVTNTVWVDSFDVIQEDTIMYLNRIVTLCDTCPDTIAETGWNCYENCFYLYNQPQFLQRQVTWKENGIYIFTDTSEFIIESQAELYDTWVFDSVNNITAEVSTIIVEPVLGTYDQVKHINLSSRQLIKLSKNFGIIQFPELKNDSLTYNLIGIEGRNIGEIVPNFWGFYDFNVGDVFEYHSSSFSPYKDTWWKGNKYSILEKTIISDTIIYEIEGYEFESYGPDPPYDPQYYQRQLVFIDSTNHLLNRYINELVNMCFNENEFCYSDLETYSFLSINRNEYNIIEKSYGADWSNNNILLVKNPEFNELLVPSLYEYIYYYIEKFTFGLGMTFFDVMYFEEGFTNELVGYIKNGDTTGIITPDSLLMPIKDLEPIEYNINIYPNPASGFFKISISENYLEAIVELYDLNGKILYTEKYNSGEEMLIELSEKHSGIYIIKILVNNTVIHKKLIFN